MQLALAAFWTIDALLQLQPRNFTSGLVFDTILGNTENQPQPVYGSLVAGIASARAPRGRAEHRDHRDPAPDRSRARLAAHRQGRPRRIGRLGARRVVVGGGIRWGLRRQGNAARRRARPGASVRGARAGRMATRSSSWRNDRRGRRGARRERHSPALGDAVRVGGALLRALPFWFPPVYALAGDFELGLDQEPHWLFMINEKLARFAAGAGLPLVIAVATLEAVIGLGVLTRYRRTFLLVGMIVTAIYWAVGQQFAQMFTGDATDIGAGPLYILLALSLWPRASRDQSPSTVRITPRFIVC